MIIVQNASEAQAIGETVTDANVEYDFGAAPCIYFGRKNLNSLLSNLLSNAVKYRSADRTPVEQVRTLLQGDQIALSGADNGLGVDLEKHGAKLFGIFNRFDSHVPGTGVGPFIIKKIIDKSGGTIHVDSTVGTGTTFYIRFGNARTK